MRRQPFVPADLKAELERALGFPLRSLTRLGGASAFNFRADSAVDGTVFLVKCVTTDRQAFFDALVEHLRTLAGQKVVRRLYEQECPPTFCGCNVICLSWCEGDVRFPDELTERELDGFLDDYLAFSDAMEKVATVFPPRPLPQRRADALALCRGLPGRILRRILDEMEPDARDYDPARLRTIHGDFHHGNFRFADGRIAAIFDLDEFRQGYPAEDIVRYFTCAAEHLRWYEQGRKRRMLCRFAQAVRRSPWSRREWMTAINARLLGKIHLRIRGRDRLGLMKALNLLWCSGFYRRLRKVVGQVLAVDVAAHR